MKTFKMIAAALTLASPIALAVPAYAQATRIAVIDQEKAVADSNAFKTAMTQMQTTYKAQFDQLTARRNALQTELKPLVDAFNTAQKAPGATQASVQPSYQALQAKNQAAEQELQRIGQPIALSRAYVLEQIGKQAEPALQAAMKAKGVDLVLVPQATVSYGRAADISDALTTELNRLVPSVQIVPPAGWQPGQQQGGAAAPAAGSATPTKGR